MKKLDGGVTELSWLVAVGCIASVYRCPPVAGHSQEQAGFACEQASWTSDAQCRMQGSGHRPQAHRDLPTMATTPQGDLQAKPQRVQGLARGSSDLSLTFTRSPPEPSPPLMQQSAHGSPTVLIK